MSDQHIYKEVDVLMGLPGCGKSYYAQAVKKEEGAKILSSDSIRRHVLGGLKQDQNHLVFKIRDKLLLDHLLNRQTDHVIVDSTNVTFHARRAILVEAAQAKAMWNARYRKSDYDVFVIHTNLVIFDRPLDLIHERNSARTGLERVPEEAMIRMTAQFARSLTQVATEDWDAIHFIRTDELYGS